MSSSDETMREASNALTRVRSNGRVMRSSIGSKSREMKWHHRLSRFIRASAGVGVVILGAMVTGLAIGGLGFVGTMATLLAIIAVFGGLMIFPQMKAPSPQRIRQSDLKSLAGKTEIWLETQRAALPPPSQVLVDQIGTRLDQLSPQLAHLGENDPAANEVRRLVGEHLPDLIGNYRRIPQNLRQQQHAGSTPDRQLEEGLKVIDREIASATEQIARGELDKLATRGRYLELKYDRAEDVSGATG